MNRIPKNRIGYIDYTCTGIPIYTVGSMDCTGNKFLRLPPKMNGAISDYTFEELAPLVIDIQTVGSRLRTALTTCPTNFDPFNGTFVDLLRGFIDNSLSTYLDFTSCYNTPSSRFETGFINPIPKKSIAFSDGGVCQDDCTPNSGGIIGFKTCVTEFSVTCDCVPGAGVQCNSIQTVGTTCGFDSTKTYDKWIQDSSDYTLWHYFKLDNTQTCQK